MSDELEPLEPTADTGIIPTINTETRAVLVRGHRKLPSPIPAGYTGEPRYFKDGQYAPDPYPELTKRAKRFDSIDRVLWGASIVALIVAIGTVVVAAIVEVVT